MKTKFQISQRLAVLIGFTFLGASTQVLGAGISTAPGFTTGKVAVASTVDTEEEYTFTDGVISDCRCTNRAFGAGTSLQSHCYCKVADATLESVKTLGAKFKWSRLEYFQESGSSGVVSSQSWQYYGTVTDAGAQSLIGQSAYFRMVGDYRNQPKKVVGTLSVGMGVVHSAIRERATP